MSDKQERRNWTREETTLALALYLRTPTSQITVTNPNVLMLAKAINRSAASVKMKLFNLASHDVRLRDKHLDSLKHGNRMDEEVWNDYMGQDQTKSLDPLINDLDNIARYFELNLPFVCRTDIDAPTETIAQIKLRRNQGFFHDTILSMYQNRCLVTGLSLSPLIEPKISDFGAVDDEGKRSISLWHKQTPGIPGVDFHLERLYNILQS